MSGSARLCSVRLSSVRRPLYGLLGVILGAGAILLPGGPAVAAPQAVCTVGDERVPEVSGLVATETGYAVVTDSDPNTTKMKVYLLDGKCDVVKTLTSQNKPRDPEDLARTADGTYWVGDIGDKDDRPERVSIAVHAFPASGAEPKIYRLKYPDGAKNAEALFVQENKTAVVVSKDAGGTAKVYTSTRPLTGPDVAASNAIPLAAAGTIQFSPTGTPNFLGSLGETAVTGAAMSPDGKKAVLRTYSDAYEWNVPDGDVAKAITSSAARLTPLPSTRGLGEAIAFSPDGKTYLTVPEGKDAPLQRWAPASVADAKPKQSAAKPSSASDGGGFSLGDITLGQLVGIVVGVGALGLALLAAGIVGIVRFRRRHPVEEPDGEPRPVGSARPGRPARPARPAEDEPPPGQDPTVLLPRVPGAVYTGGPPAAAGRPARGSVPAAAERPARGAVYGAGADVPAEAASPGYAARPRGSSRPDRRPPPSPPGAVPPVERRPSRLAGSAERLGLPPIDESAPRRRPSRPGRPSERDAESTTALGRPEDGVPGRRPERGSPYPRDAERGSAPRRGAERAGGTVYPSSSRSEPRGAPTAGGPDGESTERRPRRWPDEPPGPETRGPRRARGPADRPASRPRDDDEGWRAPGTRPD